MKIKSGYVQNSKNIQGEQLTKDSFFSKPTISTSILIIVGKFQFFLRNLKSMDPHFKELFLFVFLLLQK